MKYLLSTFLLVALLYMTSCTPASNTDSVDLTGNSTSVELFGNGLVSTGLYERDIAISPDGKEIIYTLGDYKQSKRCLAVIRWAGKQWGKREILSISGQYQDIEPFYANAGKRLFFASNRPVHPDSTSADYNIWYSDRTAEGWDTPVLLNTNVNTSGDDFYPSVASNGNLYFTATKADGVGREDIYISRLVDDEYQAAQLLDTTINTPYYEFNAFISPSEDLLIFSSFGRPDGLGGGDLYYAKKDANGQWMPAQNMGDQINSEKLDYCPFIDLERNSFYFTSERSENRNSLIIKEVGQLLEVANQAGNGLGDIYRISLDELDL